MNDSLPLEIFEVPHLAGSPFHGFAIQAHAVMLAEGLCDPHEALVREDDSAVIARVHGEVVGIATFSQWRPHTCLHLAWVLPDYRRRGIFRQMFEQLIRASENEG